MARFKPKLGNIYIMDYNDHFLATRVEANDENYLRPLVLRTIGKLVAVTPTQYNLETSQRVDADRAGGGGSHDIHGVMKPCVIAVYDLGPDPTSRRRRSR